MDPTMRTYTLTREQEDARVKVFNDPAGWLKWRDATRKAVAIWAAQQNCVRVRVCTPSGEFLAGWVFKRPIQVEAVGRRPGE